MKELGRVVSGGTPSTGTPEFWGSEINWISPADLTGYRAKTISKGAKGLSQAGLANSSATVMPSGSVHFSSRAPIGYVVISQEPLATNQGFKSLVPAVGVYNAYIYYYLKASTDFARQMASGTTFLELSGAAFGNMPVPLPPTQEQHRIVEALEQTLSELDNGIENLTAALDQLNVFRQAVLGSAFSGRLTAKWRRDHVCDLETADQITQRVSQERNARHQRSVEGGLQVHQAPEARRRPVRRPSLEPIDRNAGAGMASLPHGWHWFRVRDVCDVVRGGSPRPAGDPRYYGGTIPFLKVADLTRTPGPYVDSHTFSIKETGLSKTRLVEPQTLLLSNSGATLGVPKICRIKATFNDGIAAFLGLEAADLHYHYYFWASQTLALRGLNQGAAQPNLNTDIIGDVLIPLCSRAEMRVVAEQVELLLSTHDRLVADISEQLARSDTLRQSLFKSAFSGRLVAQDPSDEPALALIERIAAARAAGVSTNQPHRLTKTKKRKNVA